MADLFSIGSTSSSHLTVAEYERIRDNAEALILSYLPNERKPYRDMLERIDGEVFPKYTPIVTAGTYDFTVSIGDLVADPAPIVWRDQTGEIRGAPKKLWSERFQIDENGYSDLYWGRLVEGIDYEIDGNEITGLVLNEHDRVYVEYQHDLAVKPGILKRISIHLTVYDALISVMGLRSAKVADWVDHYESARNDLEKIQEQKIGIAEFDDIKLFEDYRENIKISGGVKTVRPRRA